MQRYKKISAILLSLLVLLSSTSFTLSMHFCMGEIESFALLKEAEPCNMFTKVPVCNHAPEGQHIKKSNCCEDYTLLVEGQDELKEISSVSMPDLQTLAQLYVLVSFLNAPATVESNFYKEYSPPLIERDIPVLVQSFLI